MTPDFWIGLAFGAVIVASALLFHAFRPRPGDIREWSDEEYEPQAIQPRAVTRIQSKDLNWEIDPK